MDDLKALARTHGVFLRREAIKRGYDDTALTRFVRRGLLARVRHGAYAFADHWKASGDEARHLMRAAAVMRAAADKQALSHVTAALCHGADVWDVPLGDVHLTRLKAKAAGRREAGVARHRGRLTKAETEKVNGLRCTNPTRTALDLTSTLDVQHALVVVCSLLHAGKVDIEDLREQADKRYRHVPGSLTTNLVLGLADKRIQKPGEARTRYALWAEGLPAPVPQFEVFDDRGHLFAQLDFAWPEQRVWLEFDGKIKYGELLKDGESPTDAVVREKKREDEVRRLTGWICIRVTWSELNNPAELARRIRNAFVQQAASPA